MTFVTFIQASHLPLEGSVDGVELPRINTINDLIISLEVIYCLIPQDVLVQIALYVTPKQRCQFAQIYDFVGYFGLVGDAAHGKMYVLVYEHFSRINNAKT